MGTVSHDDRQSHGRTNVTRQHITLLRDPTYQHTRVRVRVPSSEMKVNTSSRRQILLGQTVHSLERTGIHLATDGPNDLLVVAPTEEA